MRRGRRRRDERRMERTKWLVETERVILLYFIYASRDIYRPDRKGRDGWIEIESTVYTHRSQVTAGGFADTLTLPDCTLPAIPGRSSSRMSATVSPRSRDIQTERAALGRGRPRPGLPFGVGFRCLRRRARMQPSIRTGPPSHDAAGGRMTSQIAKAPRSSITRAPG